MNLQNMVAKCRRCDSLVDLRTFLSSTDGPSHRLASDSGPAVTPPGYIVDDSGQGLRIIRRWFHPVLYLLLFFCIAWDSFLVFWYSMAFRNNAPWIVIVFPIAHLAVGVGLTYYTIAGFFNRTTITIEGDEISVRHGPVPWMGNVRVPIDDLAQIRWERNKQLNRNGGVSFTYRVKGVTRGGASITLISALTDRNQAVFIQQQIEGRLGLRD
jgi:hypothetical protein